MIALAGCVGTAGAAHVEAESAPAAAASYVDADQYTIDRGDAAFESWRALQATLKASFDDVCGDTFCEGDYSNLEPIRLRCSVDAATGVLKACTYVFAGSYETITPSTGSIKVNARTFSCHLPVAGIALDTLVQTLSAAGTTPALQRPLPGSARSIYDALGSCL